MKLKSVYVCSNCGETSPRWMGRCPSCGSWNTMNEDVVAEAPKAGTPAARQAAAARQEGVTTLTARRLSEISTTEEKSRILTGISELDRVLGGGIVLGGVVLLSGEPGVGKSTMLLQLCGAISNQHSVLYITGEESVRQVKLRAARLKVPQDNIFLAAENDVDEICGLIEKEKPDLVVIDSIQTMYISDNDSPMGSPAQIRDCTAALVRFAKANNITVMIIGHVTKEGNLAGPRILEHMVDVVLYLEGDRSYQFRVLRTVKNRFGSTADSGLFVMEGKGLIGIQDPSTYLLRDRAEMVPGSIVMACMEGLRPILIEIQALTTHSVLAIPRRISSGYDYNRLVILLAVLEKRGHVMFSSDDVYLNVAGGFKVRETAADLAVALALVSMKKEKPIPSGLMALGEIGLTGEILPVSHIGIRLKEGIKMNFKQFILPSRNKNEVLSLEKSGKIGHGLDIHFVEKITQALDFL